MNFRPYIPEQFDDQSWMRNLLSEIALPVDFSDKEIDQFTEDSSDGGLKSEFKNKDLLNNFWPNRKAEYGN